MRIIKKRSLSCSILTNHALTMIQQFYQIPLSVLSDTTARRSVVDRKDLNHAEKRRENKKVTNRAVFSTRPFPNILKHRDHR